MVAGKAGKAAVDGIKTATHKVKEGVNFVASTAKGFADKIGSLWNKGATTVKTTFLQGNEKIQYAVKTLLEYKWIPGLGKAYVMPGVGMVREMGQHSLKDAYQYMKSVGEKGVKGTGEGSKIENISKLTTEDIPTAKSGKFNDFFNSLSSAELDGLWKDKKIRKKIERQLREPGGLYEWHLVSRAPQFKFWDISAEKIKDLRTAISDVKFVNPKGVHGGLGSTKAHNELLAIIDTSNDYNTFIRRLNNWAYYRLEGGISSLPEGLRLK